MYTCMHAWNMHAYIHISYVVKPLVTGMHISANMVPTVLAATVPKDTNFHWIRMDHAGNWSHKPGGTPVRNTEPGRGGRGRACAF